MITARWEKHEKGWLLRVQPAHRELVAAGMVVAVQSWAKRETIYRVLERMVSSNFDETVQFWQSRHANYEEVRQALNES